MKSSPIIVTGIGTGVGKTLVAAILSKALNAAYWKPIQTGFEGGNGDSDKLWVKAIAGVNILEEYVLLEAPLSPHAAAAMEEKKIDIQQFKTIPQYEGFLVIEGAGGLMVPLNHEHTLLDIFSEWKFPVVLVSSHYLGSINHTLLSIEALKNRNIPILGIVFNGVPLPYTEEVILEMSGLPVLLKIPTVENVNSDFISEMALNVQTAIIKQYYATVV
jgi:dethiobiotin synthetase